jgi:hypothetical protein
LELKTADQTGAVFDQVPRARQRAALAFLEANVMRTPEWLAPEGVLSRIGPPAGPTSLATYQAGIITALMDARRIARLDESGSGGYRASEYFADLRRALWRPSSGSSAPDANRRMMQRVHLERLAALLAPPSPPATTAGAGGGGGQQPTGPAATLLAAPNVPRSDMPALARGELISIRADAQRFAANAPAGVVRAHWQDVVARIDATLDPKD